MARQTTEEILKFVVQATGNESLTPIVRSILDLTDNSEGAQKAVLGLLDELAEGKELGATLQKYKELGAAVLELSKKYDATRLKVAELGKNLSDTDEPTKKQRAEFEKARAELAKLGAQYDKQLGKLRGYKSELSSAGISTSNFAKAQKELSQRAGEVAEQFDHMASAAKRTKDSQQALAAAQKELEKQLTVGERQAIRAAVASEKLARATASVSNEQQAAAAKSSILGGAWTKLAAIGATLAGYLTINAAVQGVKNLLGLADATEKTKIRLEALYGSAEAGDRAFAQLRELSRATGVEFAATAEAAARLKSFGIEPLDGSLQALIDQNARLGGSQETLNGLILAVGQAWAKQKLQGEEILQLVERGVPVWDLLSKATGKNVTELQKLSEAGKLGRTEIAALVKEIGASAEGAAAQNLGTFGGLITQIKDQWQQFLLAVADAGVLDYAKQQITALLEEGKRLAADGSIVRYAQATANALTSVASAIGGAVKLAYEYSGALVFVGKSLVALKFAQLLIDLGSFSTRMKAAAVDALAMATASTTTAGKLGALATAAKSIPTSIKLAITAIGIESTITNLLRIIELKGQIDAEDEKRRGAQELSAKLEDEINAKITANLAEYAKFAGVAIKSQEELAAASRSQADEYRVALEGARAYYNTLEVQAKRTNNALGLTEAREKLKQLEVALGSLDKSLVTVAESNKKAAVGITEFARQMVRGFLDAQAAGADAALGLQGAFDKLDLLSGSGIRDAISAIKSIGNISAEAGLALEDELRARLAKLSNQDFAKFKKAAAEAFAEGSDGAKRLGLAIEGINLTRLGVDISEIKTGFSDAGATAIAAFKGAIEEVGNLGLTGKQQSEALSAAFDNAFGKISTRPELEALRNELAQAFSAGKISADEYAQRLQQVSDALERLKDSAGGGGGKPGAAGGIREVSKSANDGEKALDFLGDEIDKADASFRDLEASAQAVQTSMGDMSESLLESAMAMQAQARSGRDIIKVWDGVNKRYQDQNKQVEDRMRILQSVIDGNDEEAASLQRLGDQYDAISTEKLKRLNDLEKKFAESRKKKADDTNAATQAEREYRDEIEKTLAASQQSGQLEYVRRIAVDVKVSADASVGGQTLSQATLDQIVVKITPAVTRAVLDELRANQSAAGY